jgi:hypothetical protein
MILFVDNNVGVMFLSYGQIIVPPEIVPSHGYGGVTPQRATVRIMDNMLLARINKEDEELVILTSQIIMKNGTFGLS